METKDLQYINEQIVEISELLYKARTQVNVLNMKMGKYRFKAEKLMEENPSEDNIATFAQLKVSRAILNVITNEIDQIMTQTNHLFC